MKLTQRRIEELTCPPPQKDKLFSDDEQTGLYVRVDGKAKKGSLDYKSYLAKYSFAGQRRKVPLGACSAISLAGARDAVRALLGDVAKGRDPAAERILARQEAKRKAADEALTLAELLAQWESLHLINKRPNYASAATYTLRRVFGTRLEMPAAHLNRAAVVRVIDGLAKDGKIATATATRCYGSAMFGWAIKRGALTHNPFEKVPVTPNTRRDRVLKPEEIRRIWEATDGPGPFNAIVRGLLLTGQRRVEVAGLSWREIDPDLTIWTLPAARSKNAKPHLVAISPQMRKLLNAQPRVGETDFVFPGERAVFAGWSRSKARLDKECGVSDWTLHDLRRTAATGMAELGVAPHVVEVTLNHVSGHRSGVAGIYNHARHLSESRRALELWGAHVEAVVEGREPASNNVVAFTRPA